METLNEQPDVNGFGPVKKTPENDLEDTISQQNSTVGQSDAEQGLEKEEQDPNIVDWNGPTDPENPLNWSSPKKLATLFIVTLITFLS